jgi:glycosyltransferase involved in cell wall biosynthesis
MASGVPVISTKVAAIPELITHNETGLLVPPDDPDALGDAILYALDNRGKMDAIAVNARQKIQSHFTWDKTARACVAIYEQYVQ